jgi:hypothetical protein
MMAIYSIAPVTTRAQIALQRRRQERHMIAADALAAGRVARSAVKSTGTGMSSPSQYPLINSG